jgi:hypothetical protein
VAAEKLDSQKAATLKIPQIILVLNSAMITLVLQKYGGARTNLGFETTQKRKRELQSLIEPLGSVTAPEKTEKGFAFDLTKLDPEVLYVTRVQFKASKNSCSDVCSGVDVQSDDLNNLTANRESSFEWREIVYRQASDKIFADVNDFEVSELLIEYLRYPKPMDIAGYIHFNGSASTDIDCELPGMLHNEILDFAVYKSDIWRRNPEVQFSGSQLGNTE